MEQENWFCKCIKKKGLLFLVLLLVVVSIYAGFEIYNQKKINEDLEAKIKNITKLESVLKNKDSDFMEEFYKLRIDWTNEKIELETKKGNVDRELYRIVCIVIAAALVGPLFGWTYIKEKIDRSVREIVGNRIAMLTDKDIIIVKQVIEAYEKEIDLQENSTIVVVYTEEKEKSKIQKVMDKFKKVEFEKFRDIKEINVSEKNLILFCNIPKDHDEEVINFINSNEVNCFYFHEDNKLETQTIRDTRKPKFANTVNTLYVRIIESLKMV
ncbi:MAG: hypothetical protein N4A64_05435 [Marinisporobacter sp.]|jgi:hypothetical protein|nr:hypothetical protein [Marinisporobacter sp.]